MATEGQRYKFPNVFLCNLQSEEKQQSKIPLGTINITWLSAVQLSADQLHGSKACITTHTVGIVPNLNLAFI